jgi:16S rRNA (adenine1518-N6/adenine1519-N6)-dimethyltransferase
MTEPLPKLAEVIARHGLDARKSLGQHFLLDENLTGRIVRLAGDLAGRQLIEVGPGPGGLTRPLLRSEAAHVTVVEIDRRAAGAMRELSAAFPGRLSLIEQDAVGADLAALVPEPRQIIANLPYNVGSPLLVGWLRQASRWERLTLMFQLEVAERITAEPGNENYGRLAVLAQWCCAAAIVMRIPPAAFSPPPKVWSAVVRLEPKPRQPSAALFRVMERVTAAAFGQRRKMLRSALRTLGGESLLAAAAIEPSRRAETLSVAEFERLAVTLAKAESVGL